MEDKIECRPLLTKAPVKDNIAPIIKISTGEIFLNTGDFKDTFHLHLFSYEPIKKGDWYYSIAMDAAGIYKSAIDDKYGNDNEMRTIESDRRYKWKIEATTNSSLNLPLIGKSFIQKYVLAQGKIDKIYIVAGNNEEGTFGPILQGPKDKNLLAHVIILTIKESWNREEFYIEMEKVHVKAVCSALGCNTDDYRVPSLKKEFKKWFNKNY